jgi:hypothetical protein
VILLFVFTVAHFAAHIRYRPIALHLFVWRVVSQRAFSHGFLFSDVCRKRYRSSLINFLFLCDSAAPDRKIT